MSDALEHFFPDIMIVKALNGEKAYNICEKNSFDIITVDYRMPKMDGSQFVEKVKTENDLNKETPIIFITAFPMEAKDIAEKYNIFLSKKPLEFNELARTIKLLLAMTKKKAI